MNLRRLFRRDTAGKDAVSGLALGVESVPDSLASGLLAGVNPIFGLYGAMWGTFTGALFTSSAFMAVQTTDAMSIIVSDVGQIANEWTGLPQLHVAILRQAGYIVDQSTTRGTSGVMKVTARAG